MIVQAAILRGVELSTNSGKCNDTDNITNIDVILHYLSYIYNFLTLDDSRHARVSGRIVKLYSGSKPEPITCTEEGFQPDPVECSIFYRCIKVKSGKYSVLRVCKQYKINMYSFESNLVLIVQQSNRFMLIF